MEREVTLALDIMGGDHGPQSAVPAALSVLEKDPLVRVILVGLPEVLQEVRERHAARYGRRLELCAAGQVVDMAEQPAEALRRKKDSSMRVAIDLVKRGEAAACVSAGNTGALMATAKFVLKTSPGVERPAILAPVPSYSGHTFMLDLGANVECDAENLLQFACMGSVVAAQVGGLDNPRVALLNVGEEKTKGHETVRQAASLLAASGLNYVGFVEGNRIISGEVDVVVTDGFSGNVALKSMEGVASLIKSYMREEFTRSPWRRLQALAATPALRALERRLDPRRYNGASLVGLSGIVIKSHGSADALALEMAIDVGLQEVRKNVSVHISHALQDREQPCIPA